MKKLLYCFIFFIFHCVISAENFPIKGNFYPDLYSSLESISVQDDLITYGFKEDLKDETVKYVKIYKSGMLFFQMEKKFPKVVGYYIQNTPSQNTLLVLAGKEFYKDFYGAEKEKILFFGETAGFEEYDCFVTSSLHFYDHVGREYYDCTSCLKEKNKEYEVENLDDCKPGTPWVENAEGPGIGEGFTIKNSFVYPYLLIMNGYISYDKPYLYKQNNRIKKIKVTGVTSGKSKVLDVLDTPHPQTVDISFLTEPEDIRVEIADVYKGTKYDDTCINFLVTYLDKVIPYEDSIK